MKIYQGYKPFPFQEEIHRSIIDDNYFIYVLNFGRQTSKSTICKNQVVYWCINEPGSTIGFFVPYYKLAKSHFRDLMVWMKNWDIVSFNKSDLEIYFTNGSIIKFFSIDNSQGLRGQTLTHAVLDEFALYDDDIYPEIIRPMLLTSGRKVLVASTPKGVNGFKIMYEKGLEEDNKYIKSFKYTIYDNPLVDAETIAEIKNTTPEWIFTQEYMAEFISDNFSIFKGIHSLIETKVAEVEPIAGYKYFAGLDIGINQDFTVLIILNQDGNMVALHRWNQIELSLLKKYIIEVLNKWKPNVIAETNYEGGFVESVQKDYKNIEYFKTTVASKNPLIEDLIIAIENKTLSIMNNDILITELSNFGFSWNKATRTVKYEGRNNSHDDCVISLALANKSLKENKSKGKYLIG